MVYTPISSDIPSAQVIRQDTPSSRIPPYEDSGIKYQGKYKIQRSSSEYELKTQDENSIAIEFNSNLVGLPAGTYTINRGNPTKNYVIKEVVVSYHLTGNRTALTFIDGLGSNLYTLTFPPAAQIIGFSIVPKKFLGETMSIVLNVAIPANEFISVKFYGWYEDK